MTKRHYETISSDASPGEMKRILRAHLRAPSSGLAWTFGVKQGDMVVGVVLARRLYARPVPQTSTPGRFSDSIILRGKIEAHADGTSTLRLSISTPRGLRLALSALFGLGSLGFLLGFVITGEVGTLAVAGVFAVLVVASWRIGSVFTPIARDERALVADWLADLKRGLQSQRVGPRPSSSDP